MLTFFCKYMYISLFSWCCRTTWSTMNFSVCSFRLQESVTFVDQYFSKVSLYYKYFKKQKPSIQISVGQVLTSILISKAGIWDGITEKEHNWIHVSNYFLAKIEVACYAICLTKHFIPNYAIFMIDMQWHC